MKYTNEDLKTMQGWTLERKISVTQTRIMEWYIRWDGKVYISFSGGKDSTVLLDLARRMYPDIPAVFADTGLEYPEIKDFVSTFSNVIRVKPEMPFRKVIEKFGYPVIGKQQARYIRDLQNASDKNSATVNLRLTGMNRNGVYCPSMRISKKWMYLKDAPFKISEQCCDVMKKHPMGKYQKETGRMPITAVMCEESDLRKRTWLQNGCNAFDSKQPISNPMAFWTEQDVLSYLKTYNIPYSSIYGDIVEDIVGGGVKDHRRETNGLYVLYVWLSFRR